MYTAADALDEVQAHVADALVALIELHEDLGWYNPATGGFAPVPDRGGKDLKIGTIRHIVR